MIKEMKNQLAKYNRTLFFYGLIIANPLGIVCCAYYKNLERILKEFDVE